MKPQCRTDCSLTVGDCCIMVLATDGLPASGRNAVQTGPFDKGMDCLPSTSRSTRRSSLPASDGSTHHVRSVHSFVWSPA